MTKSIRNRSWLKIRGVHGYFLEDKSFRVEVVSYQPLHRAETRWWTRYYIAGNILQSAGVRNVSERIAKSEAKKWLLKRVLETNLAHAPEFNHNDPSFDNNDDPKEW